MMYGTAENRVLEQRAMVVVCQDSGKNRVLDVRARLFGCFSDTVLLNLLELS